MDQLYQALLHLLPPDFREQFGSEMLDVFRQAAADHASRASYGVFLLREIAGLIGIAFEHRLQIPPRSLLIPACAISGFFVALLVLLFMGPNTYTSVAVLRLSRPSVSERIVPVAVVHDLRLIAADVLAMPALTTIVNSNELYLSERKRLPIETIIHRMKQDVRIAADEDGRGLMISFRHPEPDLAQKVTRSLAIRVMTAFERMQSDRVESTERFLKDQTEAAANEWKHELDSLARSDSASRERRTLDVELARKRYISLKEQLDEAHLTARLVSSRQGESLTLIEAASLPSTPDRDRLKPLAAGTFAGTVLGALLTWIRSNRMRKQAALNIPTP